MEDKAKSEYRIEAPHCHTLDKNIISKLADNLRTNGYLILRNCFNKNLLTEIHSEINISVEKIKSEFFKISNNETEYFEKIKLRHKAPLKIIENRNNPELYANRLIFPIIKEILDERLILSSAGVFYSFPESLQGDMHNDIPTLFNHDDERSKTFLSSLPPFALQLFIPLHDIKYENGCTRVWPGTHLKHIDTLAITTDQNEGFIDPFLDIGDCLLIDPRTLHQARKNQTQKNRLLLFLNYCRPWFRDTANIYRSYSIKMSESERERIPACHQRLMRAFF